MLQDEIKRLCYCKQIKNMSRPFNKNHTTFGRLQASAVGMLFLLGQLLKGCTRPAVATCLQRIKGSEGEERPFVLGYCSVWTGPADSRRVISISSRQCTRQ